MTILQLGNNLADCPKCWQNFVKHNQTDIHRDTAIRTINRLLKPYRGRYVPAELYTDTDTVVFENVQSLTWFVLRWS